MSGHTPEPWRVDAASGFVLAGEAEVCDPRCRHRPTIAEAEAVVANARRIVACVNACAGIPTEALESVGAEGLRQIIELAYDKIARKAATCKNAAWRTSDQQLFDALAKLRSPT